MTKTITVGSILCGGGGKTMGAVRAGCTPRWAIDNNKEAVEFYSKNVSPLVTNADFLKADPADYEQVDLMMASFECKRHSGHNRTGETQIDIDAATKLAEFIRHLKPEFLFVENVSSFKRSRSLQIILNVLLDEGLGYSYTDGLLNAKSFGVAVNRERYILVARLGRTPALPWGEYGAGPRAKHPLVGWGEVTKDIVLSSTTTYGKPLKLLSVERDAYAKYLKEVGNPEQFRCAMQRIGHRAGTLGIWPENLPIGKVRAHMALDGKRLLHNIASVRSQFMDVYCPKTELVESINHLFLARCMGFPDNLEWPQQGRATERYGYLNLGAAVSIIGNAVCPPFAEAIVRSLCQLED
jgi:site-specific DNA-cytosine methylase